MSEQAARSALSRMNLREQAILQTYQGFSSDMLQMANTDPTEAHEKFMDQRRAELCEAYGFGRPAQGKSFAYADGVAIIPVSGSLINRFGQSYGWVTGYNFIRSQHAAAMMDDDVKLIIHDHNSNGGEAAGCFECADDIFKSRGTKPIWAVVDSNCYSASYALATAADRIIVTPSGGVGSIGVIAMHVDMSKMMGEIGVKITFIASGEHKADGNPYEALPPSVKADIQKGVDKSRAAFVALVARNRNLDAKVVYDTEARTYRAEDALTLGLIDEIATPSAAIQSFFNAESDDETAPQLKENEVTTAADTNPSAPGVAAAPVAAAAPIVAAPAAAPAVASNQAERARIGAILSCGEAKGREALANHLALNTDMSLEAAKAALTVVPVAAAAVEPAAAVADPFKQAMDAGKHPNVGADGAAAAADGGEAPHLSILRDQERMTGRKLIEK